MLPRADTDLDDTQNDRVAILQPTLHPSEWLLPEGHSGDGGMVF